MDVSIAYTLAVAGGITTLADTLGVIYVALSLACVLILRVALSNRDNPGSDKFALMILGFIIMGSATGVQFILDTRAGSTAAWNLLILGADFITIGWFLYTVEFTEWRTIPRYVVAFLGLEVVGFQAFAWTNEYHHLALKSGSYVDAMGFHHEVYGPVFWAHCVVGYGIMFLSVALLFREFFVASGVRQRQVGLFLVSLGIPLTLNVLYVFRIQPIDFTFTPVGFFVACVGLTYAIYQAKFLGLVPVGRKTAIKVMGDAFITLDGENRVIDYNDAAKELFDVNRQATGMPAGEFFAPLADNVAQFDDITNLEREITIEKDGERRHYHLSVSPVERGSETGTSHVVVLNDVTPLKRREEELRRTTERLDRFAGVVSHDLRNPLSTAAGRIELAEETGDPEEFDAVRDALERMEQMTEELLTMARSGKELDDAESVELESLISESWTHAETEEADLSVEIPAGMTVTADRQRLLHVFENLFRNAVDHNGPDVAIRVGTVTETTAADIGETTIFVEDEGAGIPEAQRDTVFDHGYTTADGGTGFGLSIVRDIVEAHGWSIDVTDGRDGGARFEITGVEFAAE